MQHEMSHTLRGVTLCLTAHQAIKIVVDSCIHRIFFAFHSVLINLLHDFWCGPTATPLSIDVWDIQQCHNRGVGVSQVMEPNLGQLVPL